MNIRFLPAARAITCAACILAIVSAASAATYVIATPDRSSRGWYESAGLHVIDHDNYIAGLYVDEGEPTAHFRSFFIFPLPTFAPGESITAISLVLYCREVDPVSATFGGYDSPDPTETYELFAVDRTSIAALRAGGGGLTDIFADLGDGTAYSIGTVMSPLSEGSDVVIPLNAAFLAYAAANLGNEIALGGAVTTLNLPNPDQTEVVFGYSGSGIYEGGSLNQTRLVITTVPEPTSAALLLSGACLYLRRQRRRDG